MGKEILKLASTLTSFIFKIILLKILHFTQSFKFQTNGSYKHWLFLLITNLQYHEILIGST